MYSVKVIRYCCFYRSFWPRWFRVRHRGFLITEYNYGSLKRTTRKFRESPPQFLRNNTPPLVRPGAFRTAVSPNHSLSNACRPAIRNRSQRPTYVLGLVRLCGCAAIRFGIVMPGDDGVRTRADVDVSFARDAVESIRDWPVFAVVCMCGGQHRRTRQNPERRVGRFAGPIDWPKSTFKSTFPLKRRLRRSSIGTIETRVRNAISPPRKKNFFINDRRTIVEW